MRDVKYPVCMKKYLLRIGHVIRHMRSGCKRIVNDIRWEKSELMPQEQYGHRIFKPGGGVDNLTRHVRPQNKVKGQRSAVKVGRSRNV